MAAFLSLQFFFVSLHIQVNPIYCTSQPMPMLWHVCVYLYVTVKGYITSNKLWDQNRLSKGTAWPELMITTVLMWNMLSLCTAANFDPWTLNLSSGFSITYNYYSRMTWEIIKMTIFKQWSTHTYQPFFPGVWTAWGVKWIGASVQTVVCLLLSKLSKLRSLLAMNPCVLGLLFRVYWLRKSRTTTPLDEK